MSLSTILSILSLVACVCILGYVWRRNRRTRRQEPAAGKAEAKPTRGIPDELHLSPEQWSIISALGDAIAMATPTVAVTMDEQARQRWVVAKIEAEDMDDLADLVARGLVQHNPKQGELLHHDRAGLPPVLRLSEAGWEQWVLLGKSP
ncbi:MAG: hypothetical protein P8Y27_04985 [Chromatiaceae bacterium]